MIAILYLRTSDWSSKCQWPIENLYQKLLKEIRLQLKLKILHVFLSWNSVEEVIFKSHAFISVNVLLLHSIRSFICSRYVFFNAFCFFFLFLFNSCCYNITYNNIQKIWILNYFSTENRRLFINFEMHKHTFTSNNVFIKYYGWIG